MSSSKLRSPVGAKRTCGILHLAKFSCGYSNGGLGYFRVFAQYRQTRLGTAVAKRHGGSLTKESQVLIKKYSATLLTLWIVAGSFMFPTIATAQSNVDPEKTLAKVQTLSADGEQQVEVKFRDKTKLKGHITKVEPVSFTLKDQRKGTSHTIAYSEVESISKSGGISGKTWWIIGGVAAGAITTWLVVKPAVCDGGAQTRGIC